MRNDAYQPWYFLYKACDLEDGSLDWAWAKDLVTTRLYELNDAERIRNAVAAGVAAAANADVDI